MRRLAVARVRLVLLTAPLLLLLLLAGECRAASPSLAGGSDASGDWPPAAQEAVRRLEAQLEGARLRARAAEDRADRAALRLFDAQRKMQHITQLADKALQCDDSAVERRPKADDFRLAAGEVDSTGATMPEPDPVSAHNAALRDEIWRFYEAEAERQRRAGLDDARETLGGDGVHGAGGPKDITVSCPHGANVRVADLSDDEQEQGECTVMTVVAPDLEAKLVIFCDGRVTTAGMR
ncbi:hypothetical protein FNF31_05113 [Cafeteria roenbergensis]|uniref:Uncharacterized protein n=2 Tax=Cafeteria roenbergensis TaxID=33653 RepID=A0A5A8D0J5_CAFRO|nr:hypothetical protein FNF31_05113 [Cafeteria roenbergensis]